MRALLPALLLLLALPCHAEIRIELKGVEGEVERNVQTFLSVQRYRERKDVDADTVNRLYNRIDGEVRNALRPFGYYEPMIDSKLTQEGSNWHITIDITPGEPVRVREVSIEIDGPGAVDPRPAGAARRRAPASRQLRSREERIDARRGRQWLSRRQARTQSPAGGRGRALGKNRDPAAHRSALQIRRRHHRSVGDPVQPDETLPALPRRRALQRRAAAAHP